MNRFRLTLSVIMQLMLVVGTCNDSHAEAPAAVKPMLNEVYALIGRHDFDAAQPIIEQLVVRYPQNYDARVARGRVYLGLEEEKKSVNDFLWALKSNPKDYAVASDLANAYSFLSDQQSAVKYVNMAIANCPQNASYLGAYYAQKSTYLRRVDRNDEAEQAQTKALQYIKSDPHWFHERLKLRVKLSRWPGVIEDANYCLPLMPKFKSNILQMRAKAYVGLKRYSEAEHDLDTAIRLSPEHRELHQDRYAVYQLMGKKDMAEKEHKVIEKLGDII